MTPVILRFLLKRSVFHEQPKALPCSMQGFGADSSFFYKYVYICKNHQLLDHTPQKAFPHLPTGDIIQA